MLDAVVRNLFYTGAMVMLTACATTPASRFYLLVPDEQSAATPVLPGDPQIGVGPVSLPKYLDRPQMVTRGQSAEIHLAATERWAEPLQENFTRVLAENLSRRLGTGRISIEPSRNRGDIQYRVTADVLQFDADASGQIRLVAYWNIHDRDGASLTGMQKSEIITSVAAAGDTGRTVDQMSAAITLLGRRIAEQLTAVATAAAKQK